jgi:hypothetical protein
MDIRSSAAYRRAFDLYLRNGAPIEQSLIELTRKAQAVRRSSQYIWRTLILTSPPREERYPPREDRN